MKKTACLVCLTSTSFLREDSLRSTRFRGVFSTQNSDAREMGRGSKTKMRGGRGGGAKETLARKPHDSAERRSPTNAELWLVR